MRTLDTPVKQIRRKIFGEVAKLGFESTDDSLIHDIEIPDAAYIREQGEEAKTLREKLTALLDTKTAEG